MDLLGITHLGFAIASLVSGAVILLLPKGSQKHRQTGWIYAISMLGLNGTALMIYKLFGRFGPFHWAALISLSSVIAGVLHARFGKPRGKWLEWHAQWMAWSYVGLAAAAASETLTRVPESPFWGMVAGATAAVVLIGALIIRRRLPGAIRSVLPTGSG